MFPMKTTSDGRQPQILKVKYLSNYWSYPHQTLNLNICNQTKHYKMTSNGIGPSMEDDLEWNTTSNGRRPLMEERQPQFLFLKA